MTEVDQPLTDTRALEPPYFAVSSRKLVILSIASLGLYDLFWMYQQWRRERDRSGDLISPFWRAFFGWFFAYSLFRRIQGVAATASVRVGYSAGWLAVAFLVINACWRLPPPYFLVSFFRFVALLPVRRVIEEINSAASPLADRNDRFSWANLALASVGGLVFLFGVWAAFQPQEATGAR